MAEAAGFVEDGHDEIRPRALGATARPEWQDRRVAGDRQLDDPAGRQRGRLEPVGERHRIPREVRRDPGQQPSAASRYRRSPVSADGRRTSVAIEPPDGVALLAGASAGRRAPVVVRRVEEATGRVREVIEDRVAPAPRGGEPALVEGRLDRASSPSARSRSPRARPRRSTDRPSTTGRAGRPAGAAPAGSPPLRWSRHRGSGSRHPGRDPRAAWRRRRARRSPSRSGRDRLVVALGCGRVARSACRRARASASRPSRASSIVPSSATAGWRRDRIVRPSQSPSSRRAAELRCWSSPPPTSPSISPAVHVKHLTPLDPVACRR